MATPSIITMSSLTPLTQCTRRLLPRTQQRYKSTTRRMTKALRLHPHGSFIGTASTLPSRSNTSRDLKVEKTVLPTIIHNPPSAAPTPFITPRLFLPTADPRWEKPSEGAVLTAAPMVEEIDPRPEVEGEGGKLPPALSRPYRKTYHLDEAQIKEIQKLRGQDPDLYSRRKLAKMFGCSEFFVGMVAPTTEERKREMRGKVEEVKAGWGKIRSFAREERGRRRELWSRDL
ncbi:hypothetical protein TWF481_005654 [Arthrobotrys musiformis]|uniref:MRPL20 n=1 Tax=Arthrobotrys musiformis TaxID=47236 RepID=A0AAV9WGE5_9PEZI